MAIADEGLINLPPIATLKTTATINSAEFSKDDKFIVTGDSEGFISVWNAATGTLVTNWKTSDKSHAVIKVIFSPDGQKMVSATENELSIWDVHTGYLEAKLENSVHNISDIILNDDGTILYAAYDDSTVVLWNVNTMEKIEELIMTNNIFSLAYNLVDNHLAIGLIDGNVSIRDAETGDYITSVQIPKSKTFDYKLSRLNYSANNKFLFGGGYSKYGRPYNEPGEVFAAEVQQGYKIVEFEKNDYQRDTTEFIEWENFGFSPNTKYVAAYNPRSYGTTYLGVFDTTTKRIVSKEVLRSYGGSSITFSHNNNRLVAGNVIYDTSVLPDRKLYNISLKQKSKYMSPGEIQTIEAIGEYSDNTFKVIDQSAIKWFSSNPSVAKFSYGKLEAVALGETVITAEHDGFKVSVNIQVQDYKIIEKKNNVPVDKIWNIRFSAPVNVQTIKDGSIYVTDENDVIIPMLYYVQSGNETNVQVIPLKDYAMGKSYTLWIKDVDSASGNPIKKYTKMDFTTIK